MNNQYNSEEQYQALCLKKALNLYGHLIVSAGLEAKIPPDEIGTLFLGIVANKSDWLDFKASFGDKLKEGKTVEVRMGDVQYFFEGDQYGQINEK